MSYNDSTDAEAVLQVPPTPPAATPAGLGAPVTQSVLQVQPLPLTTSASGTPVAPPSRPPAPIQKAAAARSAGAQLVPVPPPPAVIAPTTQTPLVIDGQNAAPQTPAATQPGVLAQS